MKRIILIIIFAFIGQAFAGSITGKILLQKSNFKVNYDIHVNLEESDIILKGGTRLFDTKNIRSSSTVKASSENCNNIESLYTQNATLEYLTDRVNVEGELMSSYARGSAFYSKKLVAQNTLETNNGDRCLFYLNSKGMHLDSTCSWNGLTISPGELITFSSKDSFYVNFKISQVIIEGGVDLSDVVTRVRVRDQVYTKKSSKLVKLDLSVSSNLNQKKAITSFLSIIQIYSKRLFR